jgi:hypothetical protein
MCYSYAQSRNNLIINIITSSILYNYKNKSIYKILGLIFGYIGVMQLFDMIFWSTQNIIFIIAINLYFSDVNIYVLCLQ